MKAELTTVLAQQLCDDEKNNIWINTSEFMEAHSVTRPVEAPVWTLLPPTIDLLSSRTTHAQGHCAPTRYFSLVRPDAVPLVVTLANAVLSAAFCQHLRLSSRILGRVRPRALSYALAGYDIARENTGYDVDAAELTGTLIGELFSIRQHSRTRAFKGTPALTDEKKTYVSCLQMMS